MKRYRLGDVDIGKLKEAHSMVNILNIAKTSKANPDTSLVDGSIAKQRGVSLT